MLHHVEIENFYSIRDRQVIDLRIGAHAPVDTPRYAPLWKGSAERAPKVVALFGPNAAGKSNVLKALAFIAWFAKDSFSHNPQARMPFERFNDATMLEAPTRIAVQVGGVEEPSRADDPEAPQCRYAYEVTIAGGMEHRVVHEGLYYWPRTASRRVRLFDRDRNGQIKAAKAFDIKGFSQALEKVLRPNASVISTLAQLKHPFATFIWQSVSTVVSNILIEKVEGSDDKIALFYSSNPSLLEKFNRDVERVDFGIRSMRTEMGPTGPTIKFEHEALTHPMPLMYESHGTRQFVRLYPYISYALETGGIALLDELDTAMHPVILSEILRWFYDEERNPLNAQLWMTCHSASLLEELSKEEVFFCEKDSKGRTRVYGLRDIQSVRRSENYYRKYLAGLYGAIPEIG